MKHTGYNDLTLGVEVVKDNTVRVGIGVVNMQTSGSDSYNYKFNGKELQNEFDINLYDYGARNYDPSIGRWMNVDPLAEKHFYNTPYMYVNNNPNVFVDPDGKDFRLSIIENKNGGYDITITSTYHVYSGGNDAANKHTVKAINAWIQKNFASYSDGTNNISFDIQAVFHDSKEDAIAAVEANPGDNLHGVFQNAEEVGDFELYKGVDKANYPTAEGLAKLGV